MYDGGCGGGWPYNVWRYVKENNGIDTSSSYPYFSGSVFLIQILVIIVKKKIHYFV